MTYSGRFLNASAPIEKHLRTIVDGERYVTFAALVDKASAGSAVVRRYRDDLREYGDLRNAIVHERSDGYPIAEPHANVVAPSARGRDR
jgi:hypothetical protein